MDLVVDAVIPHPRPRVFAVYRDRLVDLVEYLPNIRKIEVRSRAEHGDRIDLVNDWTGGGDIPAAARSVLKESMLKWTDHARWFASEFRVEWHQDIHAFPGAVTCDGTNRYVEIPEGTRLEIRGHFSVDAAKIPGIPRLLAKTVVGGVEKFMVAQIAKNTVEIAKGVAKLLAKESAA